MENYEEKYKAALGWMQRLYDGLHGKTKEEAERYFPELKDEDERIRKELIKEINGLWENDSATWPSSLEKKNKYIAWLEKHSSSQTKE